MANIVGYCILSAASAIGFVQVWTRVVEPNVAALKMLAAALGAR